MSTATTTIDSTAMTSTTTTTLTSYAIINSTSLDSQTSSTTKISTTSAGSTLSSSLALSTATFQVNFSLNLNNIAQLQNILKYLSDPNIDVSACISNCTSGKGFCSNQLIDNYKLYCVCNQGYYGYACESTLTDFTTMVCLNGGTLVNNLINGTVTSSCLCPNGTFGASCENKINPCQNETCYGHGSCYVDPNTNLAKCKCILLFYGDKCEFQSNELKNIKTAINVTTIVAICIICSFYCLFILIDIANILIKRKIKPIGPKNKI